MTTPQPKVTIVGGKIERWLLMLVALCGRQVRLCLKGRGAIPQPLQSGCPGLRARSGGGYRRFEMRLRLVLGNANAFGVALGPESGGLGGLQAIPCGTGQWCAW